VKGRDWFDFLWYVSRKAKINFPLLSRALDQKGPWKGKQVQAAKDWYLEEMEHRIKTIDMEEAKNDVKRFIKPRELPSIEIWSTAFFLDRLRKLSEVL